MTTANPRVLAKNRQASFCSEPNQIDAADGLNPTGNRLNIDASFGKRVISIPCTDHLLQFLIFRWDTVIIAEVIQRLPNILLIDIFFAKRYQLVVLAMKVHTPEKRRPMYLFQRSNKLTVASYSFAVAWNWMGTWLYPMQRSPSPRRNRVICRTSSRSEERRVGKEC